MPINAGYEYFNAEKEYLNAQTLSDKIYWLEEMIKRAPKHKSSEHFVAELKQRLKKFQEKSEKASKKKGGNKGIRKEGFQFVLVGKTNSGKSLLLSKITNAAPKIGEYGYTTTEPELGTFEFEGLRAQVVDLPSIGSENFDVGLANNADCLIEVIWTLNELEEVEKKLIGARGKRLVVVNKTDLIGENEKRKIEATMKSKKINGVAVSAWTGEGIESLKEKMFREIDMIRIYLKEPGREAKAEPLVLKKGATLKDVAEGIRKGFAETIREARVTGPSSKFPNQKIGLDHIVKDRDVVEFHTR
jgi:uncharacterized protein